MGFNIITLVSYILKPPFNKAINLSTSLYRLLRLTLISKISSSRLPTICLPPRDLHLGL